MLKLKQNNTNTIHVSDMKDGDMAVIRAWTLTQYIGSIIQRYRDDYVKLGSPSTNSWIGGVSDITKKGFPECLVELVQCGTELVLE